MPAEGKVRGARSRGGLLVLERLALVAGALCLAWGAFVVARAWQYQATNRMPVAVQPSTADDEAALPEDIPVGEPIGLIEVPRLHLSAVIANGDDDGTLRVAVGHLPDTPFPWEDGNSALAGHRDTFFRALQNIRVGDEMRVVTAFGSYVYEVRRTLIVKPNDLSVLAPGLQPLLTLVTCYPFSFLGHAPERFTVQAARIGEEPVRLVLRNP